MKIKRLVEIVVDQKPTFLFINEQKNKYYMS